MSFQSIGSIGPALGPAPATTGVGQGGEAGGEGAFGGMLDALTQQQTAADQAMVDLAVGGEQDLHDIVLAVEMESIAFELAVQIRNRLVDAYSEIFRMSI